jgi:hypothetical protein
MKCKGAQSEANLVASLAILKRLCYSRDITGQNKKENNNGK